MKSYKTISIACTLLALMFSISVIPTACSQLPPEIQQELEGAYESEIQPLINQAIDSLVQQIKNQVSAAAARLYEEFLAEYIPEIPNWREWLGWDVPAEVGEVPSGTRTQTPHIDITAAFSAAYREAGGGRKIGAPDDLVGLDNGMLVQHFTGGSFERSWIVMLDGEEEAYYLPGEFLRVYQQIGGLQTAGIPVTNPTTWNTNPAWQFWVRWGKGKRQLFSINGGEYALTQRSGSQAVHIIPTDIWRQYRSQVNTTNLGYPLSSYPLDDSQWEDDPRISASTREILEIWKDQPYRVQVFENGSILFNPNTLQPTLLTKTPFFIGGAPGEGQFMGYLSTILLDEFEMRGGFLAGDACFISTLQHAGYMAGSDAFQTALGEVSLIPIRSVISGISPLVESVYGKLIIFAAEAFLEHTGDTTWSRAILNTAAGTLLDGLYAQGIGEVLSNPAAEITVIVLEEEYEKLRAGRFSRGITTTPGLTAPLVKFTTTMEVTVVVAYDPLLNAVSGVMTSKECAPDGYAFYFLFDPGSSGVPGHVQPDDGVWNGRIHFIDLSTGRNIP